MTRARRSIIWQRLLHTKHEAISKLQLNEVNEWYIFETHLPQCTIAYLVLLIDISEFASVAYVFGASNLFDITCDAPKINASSKVKCGTPNQKDEIYSKLKYRSFQNQGSKGALPPKILMIR